MIQALVDVLFQIFKIFIIALPHFSYTIVQNVFGSASIYNKFHEQKTAAKTSCTIPSCIFSDFVLQKCEVTQKPKILTLLLKRFTFDNRCRSYVKLHSRVDVPLNLHVDVGFLNLHISIQLSKLWRLFFSSLLRGVNMTCTLL